MLSNTIVTLKTKIVIITKQFYLFIQAFTKFSYRQIVNI